MAVTESSPEILSQPTEAPLLEKSENDPSSASSIQHEQLDNGSESNENAEPSKEASVKPLKDQNTEPVWAHGLQLWAIMVAVVLVVFLMLLDGTIIVAAVPRVTDDFHSLSHIGWYGAAYQLGRYVIA